jgi:hypothetical protein
MPVVGSNAEGTMRIARDVDNVRLSPPSLPVGAQTLDWVRGLRAYLAVVVVANLIWEFAHLPLYSIWQFATPGELTFAAIHCTGGDVVIAATCLSIALVLAGDRRWPDRSFARVAALSIVLGIGYTIFSEWLNIVVRESWAYSELMPVVPGTGTGISPLLQWIVIPSLAMAVARRRACDADGAAGERLSA